MANTGLQRLHLHCSNLFKNITGCLLFTPQKISPQQFQLQATFIPSPLVLQMMPELKGTDSIIIISSYKSNANELTALLKTGHVNYSTYKTDSISISLNSNEQQLKFETILNNINAGAIKNAPYCAERICAG